MKNSRTERMILISMMTAITAVSAVISIPLPFSPVPVTLASLVALLAGGLLGAKDGAFSQMLYILLGIVGVPVFHNMTGGFGVIIGPTGGFLMGYVFMAASYGLLTKKSQTFAKFSVFAGLATLICYIPGFIWFIIVTGSTMQTALLLAILPFLPADILKCIAAGYLINRISKVHN